MGVIAEIKFKFGKGPAAPPETTKLAPITVFVGPNNSGKTKVLGELFQYCNNATTSTTDVILDKLEFAPPSPKAIEGTLRHYTVTPSQAHRMEPGQFLIGRANHGSYLAEKARFTAIMEHPQTDPGTFSCWFLQFNTLMLDGPRRISHVNSKMQEISKAQRHPVCRSYSAMMGRENRFDESFMKRLVCIS